MRQGVFPIQRAAGSLDSARESVSAGGPALVVGGESRKAGVGGMGTTCRVQVLSESALVAETLACLLERREGFDAAAGFPEPSEPPAPGEDHPDVVLVEAGEGASAAELGGRARAIWPSARMVLLARKVDRWCDAAAVEMGAVGWMSCEVGEQQLVRSLAMVHRLGRLPDLPVARPERQRATPDELLVRALTSRETTVLGLLVAGQGAESIARQLAISRNTVRTHIQNIMAKLGVHSRLEAVAVAHRAGLVVSPVIDLRDDAAYAPAIDSRPSAGSR